MTCLFEGLCRPRALKEATPTASEKVSRLLRVAPGARAVDLAALIQMARPTDYTPEIGLEICEWVAEGRSLNSWIKGEDGRPAWSTVCRWLEGNEEFRKNYARAREMAMDLMVEEILAIADDETEDWFMTKKGAVVDETAIGRSRLKIDARKWVMAKMLPKKYGDKVEVEHSGEVATTHRINVFNLPDNGRGSTD